ncbi:GrpB family protein, partial [Priestia sp. SIMBA_032]|uniref:GrpB family protein n=1 Tax=Priestia sp. SIMBA_032 TaxID=3085775 RepID=UPI00397BF8EB
MAIILIDHDPSWIETADRLIAQLREQLGPLVQRLDHVGSTAVPGLSAKPKLHIDIVAG